MGDHRPTVTLANGHASGAEAAAAELQTIMARNGPITSYGSSVVLLENATGCW